MSDTEIDGICNPKAEYSIGRLEFRLGICIICQYIYVWLLWCAIFWGASNNDCNFYWPRFNINIFSKYHIGDTDDSKLVPISNKRVSIHYMCRYPIPHIITSIYWVGQWGLYSG